MRRAGVDRGERVGDRAPRVVVAVDAESRAGRRAHRVHDVGDLVGQHAAVGVAEHDDVGAGLGGGPQDLEGVGRVAAVAVEEVLGVEEDPPALGRAGAPPCRGPSRGSPRAWCAAPARRAARGTSPRASRPARRSRAGRPPGGRRRPAHRVGGSRRTRRAARVRRSSSVAARRKNSVSLGLAPGQPPSMKPTPSSSRWRAIGQLVLDGEREALLLRAVAQRRVVDVEGVSDARPLDHVRLLACSASSAFSRTNKKTPRGRGRSARRPGAGRSAGGRASA